MHLKRYFLCYEGGVQVNTKTLIFIPLAVALTLLVGCATTSKEKDASIASAQQSADEAKAMAAEAKEIAIRAEKLAQQAMDSSRDAKGTADQALGEAREAKDRSDAMYEKSMSK